MTTQAAAPSVEVRTFKSEPDGCVGYLVIDPASGEALAVDPRLDEVERFLEAARDRTARIRWVLDTHTHADHLSGARKLAGLAAADLLAHPASRLRARAQRLKDGEVLRLGTVEVRVLHTPGHTPDSLSVLVGAHLMTGDALFVEGAGRTDFPGGSASDLYDSFRRIETLPDSTRILPGHDYAGRPSILLGEARRSNRLLAERDRAALVRAMDLKGAPPPGMAAILDFNTSADDPSTILPAELHALLKVGSAPALVDVRTPAEYASEWLEGSLSIPLADLEARADALPAQGILVCASGARAAMAARTLEARGRSYRVLEGGIRAWDKAGLPLKRGRRRLSVDRQVQLVVGTGVLGGVLLGAFVHPGFLVLAGFFGAGLAFAGLSGTCGMGMLLMKAPWNRLPAGPVRPGASCAVGGPRPPSSPGACAVGGA